MSYNITLLDSTGEYTKVFMSPNKKPIFEHDRISTNHQEKIEWDEYARFSQTLERYNYLKNQIKDPVTTKEKLVSSFFREPLFNTNYEKHFGTIYTSKYEPKEKKLTLLWLENSIEQSFENFEESETFISFTDSGES